MLSGEGDRWFEGLGGLIRFLRTSLRRKSRRLGCRGIACVRIKQVLVMKMGYNEVRDNLVRFK
jgi:hypothetical protein